MNKIYSDGSYDSRHKIGCYCIVVVPHNEEPKWHITPCTTSGGSNAMELAGVREAIEIGYKLSSTNMHQSIVLSDSLNSLQNVAPLAKTLGISLKYVRAHQANKMGVDIDDDIKRQHWADIMAHRFITDKIKELDKNMSTIHNHEHTL
jgi:ribonuclease HI